MKTPNHVFDLVANGGKWLLEARTQMQHKFINGDSVT